MYFVGYAPTRLSFSKKNGCGKQMKSVCKNGKSGIFSYAMEMQILIPLNN